MLLLEPNETPYDLRWTMFGIPVRVHPMFWLVSVIMGWRTVEIGFAYLLLWVACVFVSILIHELGHVWMGMAFGAHGHIVLYSFGGLAIGSNHLDKRGQRIAVCFAGPLAGFLFLGLVFGLLWVRNPEVFPVYVEMTKSFLGLPAATPAELVPLIAQIRFQEYILIRFLIFINLLWGLVNLLPVWPLDGGQISRDLCEGLSPERGLNASLGVSLVVAGLLALHSISVEFAKTPLLPLKFGDRFTALLFGLLALQSFQLLQQAQSQRRWTDEHWDRGDW